MKNPQTKIKFDNFTIIISENSNPYYVKLFTEAIKKRQE